MLAPIRRASRGTSYQCGDVGSDGPYFSQVGFAAGAVHLSAPIAPSYPHSKDRVRCGLIHAN